MADVTPSDTRPDAATGVAAGGLVRLAVDGPVATVTLDSPHNRNALSRQLVTELADRLERAGAEASVRVVVLTSADRVFCSGADLTEASAEGMAAGTRAIVALQRQLLTLPKPVVAVVRGPVRAGGIGIVAACDVVLGVEEATFALTEVKLGLAPAVISLTVLPRMTSRAASYAALSGATFTAAEAVSMGLVTRAVPAADLDRVAAELATELATGAPQGLRETKALLNRELVERLDARADEVADLSARLFGSDAAREAMTAFLGRPRR